MTLAASTSISGAALSVVIFCLVAAGICLLSALGVLFFDTKTRRAKQAIQDASAEAGQKAQDKLKNPAQPQAAPIDYDGLAKLAQALKALDPWSQLLIMALGFVAVAAVSAGAGAIASAVAK